MSEGFFCRDCLTEGTNARRCSTCGSPRLIIHDERNNLTIAHVDCDAFFAAVEKRDDPSLRDKPVIIGGGRRGVVSTACYIARIHGVRSAMPMFKALKACPEAVVIAPNIAKYSTVGRDIRTRMLKLTPLVEPVSIDEAFLDLTGTERVHALPACAVLAHFAREVEREVGITVSVGLSHNKFLAKIASDLDKPRGFSVIGRAETQAFLADKPIGIIWGVGKATQARLAEGGIRTIRDVLRFEESDLMRRWGNEGLRLHRLARGLDTRKVSPARETKSISAETTFDENLSARDRLISELWPLCEKVARRLRAHGQSISSVSLKLKTGDFETRSRVRSGLPPTRLALRIFETAREMLDGELARKDTYRLIGVGVSQFHALEEADQGDLLTPDNRRDVAAEEALAAIRSKFGEGSVYRGIALDSQVLRPDKARRR
jgi:DNA polymerase IV